MNYLSDLWDDIMNFVEDSDIVESVGKFFDVICEVFYDAVYWLTDIIFDAVNALFDVIEETIDWIIEEDGSFFSSIEKDGEAGILPNTKAVEEIVKDYDKDYGTSYHRKVKEGKATIAYVEDGNGITRGARIVGSGMGFDSKISESHKRNRIYATKIKNA